MQVWHKFADKNIVESDRTETAQRISAACWATNRWDEMRTYLKQVVQIWIGCWLYYRTNVCCMTAQTLLSTQKALVESFYMGVRLYVLVQLRARHTGV